MRKFFILTMLVACVASTTFAQNSKSVSAWTYLSNFKKDGDTDYLLKAREAINLATEHEKTKTVAKTWKYKGDIELTIAGVEAFQDQREEAVDAAVMAYKKTLEFDTKKKYVDDAIQNLKALTSYLYNDGNEFYQKQAFENAYKKFNGVLEIRDVVNQYAEKPEPADTASIEAAAYSADGAELNSEAIRLYKKLMDIGKNTPYVMQSLAKVYRRDGNEAAANETIAEAMKLYPNDKNLIIDQINKLLKEGKAQDAIADMEKAVELDPTNETLFFVLGTAKEGANDAIGAEAAYKKAVELNAEYFDAQYNLGALFYNKAAEVIKQMNELSLDAQDEYDRLNSMSKDLFLKALPYFEKAHNIQAKDVNTLIALKEIYAKTGDFTKSNVMKKLLGE